MIRNGNFPSLSASGVFVRASGSGSYGRIVISGLRSERNYTGVWACDNAYIEISNSVLSYNTYGLISTALTAGTKARINADHCVIAHNIDGVFVGDVLVAAVAQTVTISNSLIASNDNHGITTAPNGGCYVSFTTITGNSTGVNGAVVSVGNNRLMNNDFDGSFPGTIAQQ